MRVVAVATGALVLAAPFVRAQQPGDITIVGKTLVSAMMMFLGNDEKVYILDKSELNKATINGHPAWGAVWDIANKSAEVFDIVSNTFCAAGHHLPTGSWATFGGNHGVQSGPASQGGIQDWDGSGPAPVYGATDGRKAIRIQKPCTGSVANWTADCQEDESNQMARYRWYATAEALGDGSIMLIGGMVSGGFVNRNAHWFDDGHARDPVTQEGYAENTIEFFPPRAAIGGGTGVQTSPFLVAAGALNTYALAFLMPSGKVFMNANVSSTLLDPSVPTLNETALPNMPNDIVRVYPASAANAMLPLTPDNNWEPTLLFCGGTNAPSDYEWGTYDGPKADMWEKPASDDCQRITPEPADGSEPAFEEDDVMPDPRTMGQFVLLPDATLLLVNGAKMGTAGYTTATPDLTLAQMPFYMSLATDEATTPAIYDPSKPKGSRWNSTGLQTSSIPRLYHSNALLLPDGSVMIAGSNPSVDVTYKADNIPYPTTYDAEYFYPPYWGKPRPQPQGLPSGLGYGGQFFQVTLPAGSYANPNDAGSKAKVVLIRPGFATHAMSMGQRFMQLNSTYQVDGNGTITLSVSPPPPNPNLLTPGPVLIFVVVDGVPSVGTMILIGSGKVETQPTSAAVELPANAPYVATSTSSSGDASGSTSDGKKTHVGLYVGVAAAAAVGVAALAILGLCFWRRRRARAAPPAHVESSALAAGATGQQPLMSETDLPYPSAGGTPYGYETGGHTPGTPVSSSSAAPLAPTMWNPSGTPRGSYHSDAGALLLHDGAPQPTGPMPPSQLQNEFTARNLYAP